MSLLLAVVQFACFCSIANASPPEPANSTSPSIIPIVGRDASDVPDPVGQIEVIYRDLANDPIPGALIVLDFSGCPELHLCSDPLDPDVTVDCVAHTVSRISDANGRATFRVMGWSMAAPGSPGAGYNSGKVFADGHMLSGPSVAIYDLDSQGLGASDLSALLGDFFGGNNPARADYDNSGGVGASDLSVWLKTYFAAGSPANCSATCP